MGDSMQPFNETIKTHLSSADPMMAFLIHHLPLHVRHDTHISALEGLISTVIAQQLATSVATKLYGAFSDAFSPITKTHLKRFSAADFKTVGLSSTKSETIERIVHASIDYEALKEASNLDIFNTLTRLKGLGPWSAEMFILFVKRDPNFFSFNDGGIKNALKTFYSGSNHETLVQKFDPYKSYACLVLWEALAHKKILLKKWEETHD